MGAFDDLIPSAQSSAQPQPTGMFDDLIPQNAANNVMQRQALSGIPGGQWLPDVMYGGKRTLDALAQLAARSALAIDPSSQTLQNMAQSTDAANAQTKAAQPTPIAGSGIAQSVVPGIVSGMAAPLKAGALIGGAVAGGTGGLLNPVDDPGNDFWRQKLAQIGMGTATGAATGGAASAIGSVLSPVIGAAQQKLIDAGISMSPGQLMGGMANKLESKATSVPFVGDMIASARMSGVNDLNRAMYARALAPFGDQGAAVAASATVGNQGIKTVGNFLSNQYEQALDASVPAPFTQDAQTALAKIQSMVPSAKQADFGSQIQNLVIDNITPAGTITPTVAKNIDSKLSTLSRGYMGSQDMDQRLYGQALQQARSQVKQMFAAANPSVAPIINAADQGWATLTQLQNAGGMLGAKEGVFSPAQLMNAVKKSDNSVRDYRFSQGDALNQDLATAANNVLPSAVPDSGTAGRLIQHLMGPGAIVGAFLHPAAGIPAAAGMGLAALPYTKLGQSLTLSALTSRPQFLQSLGQTLSSLAIPAAGAVGSYTQ